MHSEINWGEIQGKYPQLSEVSPLFFTDKFREGFIGAFNLVASEAEKQNLDIPDPVKIENLVRGAMEKSKGFLPEAAGPAIELINATCEVIQSESGLSSVMTKLSEEGLAENVSLMMRFLRDMVDVDGIDLEIQKQKLQIFLEHRSEECRIIFEKAHTDQQESNKDEDAWFKLHPVT